MKYITQKFNLPTHGVQHLADFQRGEKIRLHNKCGAGIFALTLLSDSQYENNLDM